MTPLRLLRPRLSTATLGFARRHLNGTAPPPPQQPAQKPISPHINIYKMFGRPFAKVFLMGMFTYQLLYYAWVRLEKTAEKGKLNGEMKVLEGEVDKLVERQRKEGLRKD